MNPRPRFEIFDSGTCSCRPGIQRASAGRPGTVRINIIDFVRNEKWQSALSKVHYIPAYLAQTTPKSVINVDAADADDILHTV